MFICVVFACLVTAVGGSLQTTESALAAVAISLGAEEDCVQRWKDAVSEATPGTGDDEPLAVSRRGKGLVRSEAELSQVFRKTCAPFLRVRARTAVAWEKNTVVIS